MKSKTHRNTTINAAAEVFANLLLEQVRYSQRQLTSKKGDRSKKSSN